MEIGLNTNNPFEYHLSYLLPRIVSLSNRNPYSKHFGCLDRNFWHFKTIIDFPSATYQQVVLGLSHLITTKNHPYSANPQLIDLVKSGILYWCKIQNSDGSQNEYFENDRSFCPTAFTTGAIAESFYLCQTHFTEKEQKLIKACILKGSKWLAKHEFYIVHNQMIASLLSLYWGAKVTGSSEIQSAFQRRREKILSSQSEEGWFPEYSGFDTGYSFKALDLFSYYLKHEDDIGIFDACEKLSNHLVKFLHPNGTCGGNYCSRQTEHIFPFGVEFFAQKGIQSAQVIKQWFGEHLKQNNVIGPKTVDDKYIAYFYFNSYVMAFLNFNEQSSKLPERNEGVQYFEKSQLFIIDRDDLQCFIGGKRNGVFQFFYQGNLIAANDGLIFSFSDKEIESTQIEQSHPNVNWKETNEMIEITIEGHTGPIDDSFPLEKYIVPFKLFCKTVLRLDFMGYWFSNFIKRSKIAKLRKGKLKCKRTIRISKKENNIEVKDQIKGQNLNEIKVFKPLANFTVVHSPSSRFSQIQHILSDSNLIKTEANQNSNQLNVDHHICF